MRAKARLEAGSVCVSVCKKSKLCLGQQGVGMQSGGGELSWNDRGGRFLWHKLIDAWARSLHLLSTSLCLFADRCESYRLLKLLGFLPVHCLILPFMCLAWSKGVAWHRL